MVFILKLIDQPEFPSESLYDFYTNFIQEFAQKVDQIKLMQLVVKVCNSVKGSFLFYFIFKDKSHTKIFLE